MVYIFLYMWTEKKYIGKKTAKTSFLKNSRPLIFEQIIKVEMHTYNILTNNLICQKAGGAEEALAN